MRALLLLVEMMRSQRYDVNHISFLNLSHVYIVPGGVEIYYSKYSTLLLALARSTSATRSCTNPSTLYRPHQLCTRQALYKPAYATGLIGPVESADLDTCFSTSLLLPPCFQSGPNTIPGYMMVSTSTARIIQTPSRHKNMA